MTKKYLILFFFLFTVTLNAEIVETEHMSETWDYLKPEMLVVFDIDNTIMEPVQTLGSDQWFHHRIGDYESYGYPKKDALELALREWMSIQNITQVKFVEEGTGAIIKKMQDEGYIVMGLTTRGLGMSTRTVHQLESLGIDFHESAPSQEEIHFMNGRGVLFRGGILFTAATHKGEALRKLLNKMDYRPKSIIFINDKYSHIVPVEEMCEAEGIPFVGLRYGFVDEKVKNFPTQIAEVQFYHFGHILSDQAAQRILHEHVR